MMKQQRQQLLAMVTTDLYRRVQRTCLRLHVEMEEKHQQQEHNLQMERHMPLKDRGGPVQLP